MAFTVLFIGDSFTCQGGHSVTVHTAAPSWLTQTLSPVLANSSTTPDITGNGFQAHSGTDGQDSSSVWSSTGETGLVPTVLASIDSLVATGPNYNYANSGSGWNSGGSAAADQAYVRLQEAVAAGITPDAIIIGLGTNPNISTRSTVNRDAEFKQVMDLALTTSAKFIIHWLSPSLNNSPVYDPAQNGNDTSWQDYTEDQRQFIIDTVSSDYASDPVYLYDAYTDFGGNSITAADFKTAPNIHPSAQGSEKLGNGLASVFNIAYRAEVLNMLTIGVVTTGAEGTSSNIGSKQGRSTTRTVGGGAVIDLTTGSEVFGIGRFYGWSAGSPLAQARLGLFEGAENGGIYEIGNTPLAISSQSAEIPEGSVGSPNLVEVDFGGYSPPAGISLVLAVANDTTQVLNVITGADGSPTSWSNTSSTDAFADGSWATTKLFDYGLSADYTIPTTAPILTTPYSIGTDGGPLYVITTSDTLATIEASGFFNGNAGYASLLKTGDVVLIKASNGTKMYNVTVDPIPRIITLSTGTVIA